MVLPINKFLSRLIATALAVVALSSATGCSTAGVPCLTYQPMMLTRTVSMRGYGMVQVTEEKMVCTERAEVIETVAAAD